MTHERRAYPSDVSDDEWSLIVPHLTLMGEDAPQRTYPLHELFNVLRYVIRYGIAWRAMPHDLPAWSAVYRQSQRWLTSGCFEAPAQDIRAVLRMAAGHDADPTAAIIDSRTLRSMPGNGPRAGHDCDKRNRGSKRHISVDTFGHLLALRVAPADVDDRAEVGRLAEAIQDTAGESVALVHVVQGYPGKQAADAARSQGIEPLVVKLR